ncbi:hypothetical protein BN871_CL_00350 [Paenibacillus sp. P22]|nr:hypothetical protein BN871_CL_00350 [Paenibacillus sp. P22]
MILCVCRLDSLQPVHFLAQAAHEPPPLFSLPLSAMDPCRSCRASGTSFPAFTSLFFIARLAGLSALTIL